MPAAPSTPLHLGLSGGIGSGKSTVARVLRNRGAALVDADAISRASTAAGGAAIEPIRRQFGAPFITPAGALDRDRMRQHVYAQPSARQQLEAIIHPLVGRQMQEQAQAAAARGTACVVFDIPLLVEGGVRWRQKLDRILIVDCDRATQIARVQTRDQLDVQAIERILDAQASRMQRLRAADAVIFNGAGVSLSDLTCEATRFCDQIAL